MRRYLITGLIVLNVILAVMVGASLFHAPVAKAQPTGLAGNYLMVNGSVIGLPNDVVYMIDLTNRQLSALYYDRVVSEVTVIGQRDLVRDLAVPGGQGIPRAGPPEPVVPRQFRPPDRKVSCIR